MKLTVVGCSGSVPGPDTAASCYLVEAPDPAGRVWRVLLDLGSGALGPLQQYGDPRELDAVLLSHLHPDHCLDLTGLYVQRRYAPGRRPGAPPMPVWGPRGVAARITRAYDPHEDAAGSSAQTAGSTAETVDLSDQFDFRHWRAGQWVTIGPLAVLPVPVRHPVEAYGLRLTWREVSSVRDVVLAYSGDTDQCEGLDRVAAGADVLLCEAAFDEADAQRSPGVHLTGRLAGGTAARAGVGCLVVTHVPPWRDPQVVAAAAGAAYSGPVESAVPGMVVDVARVIGGLSKRVGPRR